LGIVLCVLYDDPVDGYPPSDARDDIPKIERYLDGQTTPTPSAIDRLPRAFSPELPSRPPALSEGQEAGR
jgi:hypothetical protein